MKFKVGDQILVTAGKDKGKHSTIVRVIPSTEQVVVKDVNLYTRHVKPMSGRAGEIARRERPLSTAKVAILNDKGQADRIGYQLDKAGNKTRVYKKTGQPVAQAAVKPAKVAKKTDESATKKTKK